MGTVSLVALACAAAAGWLGVGPAAGSRRLHRLAGATPARRKSTAGRPAGTSPAGLASDRARVGASLVAGIGVTVLVGGASGVLAGIAAAIASWVVLGRLEPASIARDRNRMVAAIPLAAELISAGLAAGSPPDRVAHAVGAAIGGPLGDALCRSAATARLGAEPATSWASLLADPACRSLGRALAGAVTRGASPVAALERVAIDARDRARWEAEARARSLGARAAAPLGLCFLPAFVLVGIVPLIATVGLPLLP